MTDGRVLILSWKRSRIAAVGFKLYPEYTVLSSLQIINKKHAFVM